MKEIKKVLVLGLGAIGTIYATKLINNVKILVDKTRLEKYSKNGIFYNNEKYNFEYILEDEHEIFDLIIISTKSFEFEKTADMIKNFVGKNTIIMSLLNGIQSEKILIEKYKKNILYSYFLGHSSMRVNNKIIHDGIGKIFFGENNNKNLSENVITVKNFFEKNNIEYEIPEDMISALWQKLIINVGVNQTCAYFKQPMSCLKEGLGHEFAIKLMQEAIEIAKEIQIKDAETFLENALQYINSANPKLKPSMLQDIENNNKTEVEIFAGEIVHLGKKLNIKTPQNELVLKKFL